MIQLYTGDGKGKTTAALGQGIRFAGSGGKVIFAQFMKGNDTSELAMLGQMEDIQVLRSDRNFGFYSSMTEEDKREITAIHDRLLDEILEKLRGGQVQMVILDEITYPVKWKLLSLEKLQNVIQEVKQRSQTEENGYPELIFTGRNPEEVLWQAADYISEIKAIKHPYEKGVKARKGIEY